MSSATTRQASTGACSHRAQEAQRVCWELVFVVDTFTGMPGEVSRICNITARDLARNVSYYSGMPSKQSACTGSAPRSQKA